MSIEIGNLNLAGISASERRRIADRIAAMSYEEQKQFIEQLGSVIEVNAKANAETSRKKTVIERINAAKADAQGGRATIDLLNGNLKRGGLPPVEQLVEKQPDEIMKLFAESTMASLKKMECKIALSKLKVIP